MEPWEFRTDWGKKLCCRSSLSTASLCRHSLGAANNIRVGVVVTRAGEAFQGEFTDSVAAPLNVIELFFPRQITWNVGRTDEFSR